MRTISVLIKIGSFFLAILIFLLVIVPGVILYFLFIPLDVLRYYRMPYSKETGRGFKPFITSRRIVKIYNYINKSGLPIEYFCNQGFEYFLRDNCVLIPHYDYECFEEERDEWFYINFEENSEKSPIADFAVALRRSLKEEHAALPVKFIVSYGDELKLSEKQDISLKYFISI